MWPSVILKTKVGDKSTAASLLTTNTQVNTHKSYDHRHAARVRFKFVVCFEVLRMWVHTRINTVFIYFFESEVFALRHFKASTGQGRNTPIVLHSTFMCVFRRVVLHHPRWLGMLLY